MPSAPNIVDYFGLKQQDPSQSTQMLVGNGADLHGGNDQNFIQAVDRMFEDGLLDDATYGKAYEGLVNVQNFSAGNHEYPNAFSIKTQNGDVIEFKANAVAGSWVLDIQTASGEDYYILHQNAFEKSVSPTATIEADITDDNFLIAVPDTPQKPEVDFMPEEGVENVLEAVEPANHIDENALREAMSNHVYNPAIFLQRVSMLDIDPKYMRQIMQDISDDSYRAHQVDKALEMHRLTGRGDMNDFIRSRYDTEAYLAEKFEQNRNAENSVGQQEGVIGGAFKGEGVTGRFSTDASQNEAFEEERIFTPSSGNNDFSP